MAEHRLEGFCCGEPALNEWLRRRALSNQASGASRTFVVTDETQQVLAYYALAAGAVLHSESPGSIRRNRPGPMPVMVLARLAVDQRLHGQQMGSAMLKDALQRAGVVAQHSGVRALLVHALHERARGFYLHYGFVPSPANPMTLMLALRAGRGH